MGTVSQMISDETLNRIITIESAGNPKAKAKTSSATGLGQFISSTWMTMVKRYHPEWMDGRTKQEVLDLRLDPKKNIEMLARFTEENAKAIPGEKDADGDLYLAHFAGVGVAKRLFSAPGNAAAENYFTPDAVRANHSIIAGKTVDEVQAWAERKMRNAGGRNWIAKYYAAPPLEREQEVALAPNTEVPREVSPDTEWTYPEPKKEGQGVEGALQVGGGLTLVSIGTMIWESITNLPDRAWNVVDVLVTKPQFWIALAAIGAVLYGIHRWRKFRREADA